MNKWLRSLPTTLPADSVEAIKRFATYPRPKLYELRPPATEANVYACEEKLGYALPPELRSVLLVHDGLVEVEHNKYDLLGGTRTLPMLRRAFLNKWKHLVVQFEYGPPFTFGKRYIVIGGCYPKRNEFVMLDTRRLLDGMHPVVRVDLDASHELQGFRSLTHYLQWAFLDMNDRWPHFDTDEMFPERSNAFRFKKMMKAAIKVP
jgi:hypothetical protein